MGKIDFTGIGNNIVEELRIDGQIAQHEIELGGGSCDGDIGIGIIVEGLKQF